VKVVENGIAYVKNRPVPRKTVVITGVTRGLGKSMVDEFIRLGHVVLGCGRAEREIQSLKDQFGDPHDFYSLDVSSDTAVQSWASVCLQCVGPPDLLINNAAVINPNARLWELDARQFNQVIEVNVIGVANVLRHFLPVMIKRRSGVVVNFSSGWGRSTDAEVAPYCASKWAIEGLTMALAQELPSGVAAVSVNPGIVNTSMLQSCFGPSANSYPSPGDWASKAVPFLLQLSDKDNGSQTTVPS
jgi:NAD(P)-dependent dehydrogenase (short-subunit alcohol dehydrogenase family)